MSVARRFSQASVTAIGVMPTHNLLLNGGFNPSASVPSALRSKARGS